MAAVKAQVHRKNWIVAILLSLAASMLVAAVSCGNGVSDEELSAVQNELQAEKNLFQSLKSELAAEQAEVARLAEDVGLADVRLAGLESELAKERATVASNQERIDAAEAQAALFSAFLAWNRKDREGFASNFTDTGLSGTVLSIPDNLGEPSIALRNIMESTVSEDTVTIHAMFALGTHRNSVRYSMAKEGGVWKVDTEERLSPKIKGEPTVVDVRLDGCTSLSESEAVVEVAVAITLEDTSESHQHLILKKVPENLDLEQLLQGDVDVRDGVVDVAFIADTKIGETMNVAFTQALQPGRYALVCYSQSSVDAEYGQSPAEGIVATVTVK